MPALEQWSITRDLPEQVLTAGHSYSLKNTDIGQYVVYGERSYGINLVWKHDFSREMWFRHSGVQGQPVRFDDRVAIAIADGGYLRYGERRWGINLVWSDEPVYEWQLTGGPTGSTISYANNAFGLYNRVAGHVVYCTRSWGINLRWADDCSSFDQAPHESRVAVVYRIPLEPGGTRPSFGSVTFAGTLTSSQESSGSTSFERVDQWEAAPGAGFGLASANLSGLRPGAWRLDARSPRWLASCALTLHPGSNQNVNFQEFSSGCDRGFNFPAGNGAVRGLGGSDEHPRVPGRIGELGVDGLDMATDPVRDAPSGDRVFPGRPRDRDIEPHHRSVTLGPNA